MQIPRARQRAGATLKRHSLSDKAPLPHSGRGSVEGLHGRRVGLLGGSFNPAHGGHLHISRLALTRLDLDEIWWLVSPQNPLKPTSGMVPFAERLRYAAEIAAADRRIRVTDIEARLGSTTYTADTLKTLLRRFPRTRFVWLMGGDNLAQIPYWRRWQDIFRIVPIAVFARPGTSSKALTGAAAYRFAGARVPVTAARLLAEMSPPAWVFFHTRLDPRSATQIRAARLLHLPQEKRPDVMPEMTAVATLAPRRRERLSAPELLRRIIDILEDGKAEEIVTLDLAGKSTIADYMVVATGRSARQVIALTDHLEQALPRRVPVEGKAQGDWVLIDAGDVIVHIFRPEIRAYYNLEKMWGADLPEAEPATAVLQ
ncbi:MAG TPA: nicotinate-nucleotide adenylyltransferase [Stellaceae bacterium]|nr:nicotinate-nucleotide adenylyltransferase [Stellaceae bacterium]